MKRAAVTLVLAWAFGGPAQAQLLGGALPSLPSSLPGGVAGLARDLPVRAPQDTPSVLRGLASTPLEQVRRLEVQRLLREHPDIVEPDNRGQPAVRGEVLAVAPGAEALARVRAAGFAVRESGAVAGLDLQTAVLTPPAGMTAVEAVRRLRAMDPAGQYDFNHLYQEGGLAIDVAVAADVTPQASGAGGLRIGLVDGSAAAGQPALRGAKLVQRAFAPGGAKATAHATAVASLIAGAAGRFQGAAPGATLYVADVYGPGPTGGSAEAIARGLGWLAEAKTPVINISLVGPPNLLLQAAMRSLIARGHLVVAAVGNDGPAAAPLYPAAYPGVVAVTAVDARRRVLPEAGRGTHVDFAGPGADMAAAGLDGFISVRGTSFAAPLAAGRLAGLLSTPDPAAASRAVAALGREAVDLGPPGSDPVYGRGLIGFELRSDPAAVGARTTLRGR